MSCYCEKTKSFAKKWLPVIGCAVAIVALIGVCCVSMSFNRKLSAVSGEVSAAVSELKGVSETLGNVSANLAENAKAAEELRKELDSVKEDIKSLDGKYAALTTESGIQNGRLNEIEAGVQEMGEGLEAVDGMIASVRDLADIRFEAEPYPATYEFTERSIEEFRDCFISEILPYVKDAQGFTEEEFAAGLEQMKDISGEDLFNMIGIDTSVMKLSLTSPTTLMLDDNVSEYENRDGVFYVEGEKLGTISDEAIAISLEAYGIPGEFRLYKTDAPASTISLKDKIQLIDAAIEELSATVEDNNASIEDVRTTVDYYVNEAFIFADEVYEELDKTADYIDEVIADEEEYILGIVDEALDAVEDYKEFKQEAYAFADEVQDIVHEAGQLFNTQQQLIESNARDIMDSKDALEELKSGLASAEADHAALKGQVTDLSDMAGAIVTEFDGRLDSLEGFAESYGF